MKTWKLKINGEINTLSIEEIKSLDDTTLSDTSIRKNFRKINLLNASDDDKAILRNKARFALPRTLKIRRKGKVKTYTSEQVLKWDECVFDNQDDLFKSLKMVAHESNYSKQPDSRYEIICGSKKADDKSGFGFMHIGLWKPMRSLT